MKYLTLKRLMSWEPCYDEAKILEMSGGRKRIKIDDIFELNISDENKLWILLREPIFTSRELHLMTCDFVDMSLLYWNNVYPYGHRLRECIKTARRFVVEDATEIEFRAAWEVACATAEAACMIARAARATWIEKRAAFWVARKSAKATWEVTKEAGEVARAARVVRAAWEAARATWARQLKIVKKYWIKK